MIRIEKNKRRLYFGAAAIMVAALFWSLDGVFLRPKFYELPAALIVFLEHFLGFIVLIPFIFLNWGKIKSINAKDWGALVWVSLFGGLLGTLMITKAFFAAVNGEVTFATVVILQKLQPFFALLMARIVLREKMKSGFYMWAALAILSAFILTFGKTGIEFSGLDVFSGAAFFAFLAAFAFGSSTVFGKRLVNHLDFGATTALRFGVTSVFALILILLNGDLGEIGAIDKLHWIYLGIIVMTSGAFAMFLYYFGLKRVSASSATICELFWPFSAVILDYFINHNTLNWLQIGASLLILFAFYKVVNTGQEKDKKIMFKVTNGQSRGEKLGYPTINLNRTDLDIPYGVYSVEALINGNQYDGLMHFGHKETFSEPVSTEVYFREFIFDIPAEIELGIKNKVREIKKFNNSEELKKQIQKDVEDFL